MTQSIEELNIDKMEIVMSPNYYLYIGGKTTSTKVFVKLLQAMQKKIILAAPTGRAAQRMSEVIALESKTIHRLLEWAPQKKWF